MTEGKCVQILHLGPFEKEPETLKLIDIFIKEKSLRQNGPRHEIYLSDFRRTAPEKLKTILREPVILPDSLDLLQKNRYFGTSRSFLPIKAEFE